ncbi:hypothetical protein cypCar_00043385 [Cyprinus carpio]|nr:hypothetical protein cypCar_00043385 [Cyprinus carpio]
MEDFTPLPLEMVLIKEMEVSSKNDFLNIVNISSVHVPPSACRSLLLKQHALLWLVKWNQVRTGKYDLAKSEKVYQSEAGSYKRLTDDQTSLQHIPIVEIHDHQGAPASEVLPALEKHLEQDLPQPQDVHTPVSLTEEDKLEELVLDQPSLQHIVVIYDLHEAPVSEVLIIAEEQLEQDVLQPRDVDAPVSSAEDDKAELDKDQTSLQQIVEIHNHGEAPVSEVLPAAEEQLEQNVLQPQDVHNPVSSTDDDEAEEPDNNHIFWQYEFGPKLGEGSYSYVHAGTRCKDGLKVVVKIAEKTLNMPYIRVPGHPKRLPWRSA